MAAFLLLSLLLQTATFGTVSMGSVFEKLFPNAPQTQLAMFHTVFNLTTVLLVLPLTDLLIRLVIRIIPDRDSASAAEAESPRLYYIDEKMLATPPITVAQFKNELVNMAEIAMNNFSLSLHIICTLDFTEIKQFRANEEELNYLNKELVHFLGKLSNQTLSAKDHSYLSTAFHSVSDLERIGDYAENIVEYADSLLSTEEAFSNDAIQEINLLQQKIKSLFDHVMKAYIHRDLSELSLADQVEDSIDDMTNEMAENHIRRLNEGVCTPTVGAQYLSFSSNAERVADHFINVANTIRDVI